MWTTCLILLLAGLTSMAVGDPLRPEPRIIGGKKVTVPIPYKVLIYVRMGADQLGAWCGGTIILAHFILTAAHCFNAIPLVNGQLDLNTPNLEIRVTVNSVVNPMAATPVTRPVNIHIHNSYNRGQGFGDNDLAIMEMPVDLTTLGGRIGCLPFSPAHILQQIPVDNSKVCTAGWGYTTPYLYGGGPGVHVAAINMNKISELNVLNYAECLLDVQRSNPDVNDLGRVELTNILVNNNRFCTKSSKSYAFMSSFIESICKHDSGSGFEQEFPVNNGDKLMVTVGVVTHGLGCGDARYPTINQKIGTYQIWIETVTNTPTATFVQHCTNSIVPRGDGPACYCSLQ